MKHLLYDWGDLNLRLFQWINGHRWHAIDGFMSLAGYIADIWSFLFYAALWALVIVVVEQRRARATQLRLQLLRFALGYTVMVLVSALLKFGFDFSRPVTVLSELGVHLIGDGDKRHSLPSGHAAFAMLLIVSLWPVLPRIARAGAVLFVVWVGVSRIWVGAHFPADVVAGYFVGILSATFAAAAIRAVSPSKLFDLSRRFLRSSR